MAEFASKAIERVLWNEDICTLSCDVKLLKKGSRKTMLFILVTSSEVDQREYCVLMLGKGLFGKIEISQVFPLFSDLKVTAMGAAMVELRSNGSTLTVEAQKDGDQDAIVKEMEKVKLLAREVRALPGGSTHSWLRWYDGRAANGAQYSRSKNRLHGTAAKKASAKVKVMPSPTSRKVLTTAQSFSPGTRTGEQARGALRSVASTYDMSASASATVPPRVTLTTPAEAPTTTTASATSASTTSSSSTAPGSAKATPPSAAAASTSTAATTTTSSATTSAASSTTPASSSTSTTSTSTTSASTASAASAVPSGVRTSASSTPTSPKPLPSTPGTPPGSVGTPPRVGKGGPNGSHTAAAGREQRVGSEFVAMMKAVNENDGEDADMEVSVRQRWIDKQMRLREKEFTEILPAKVCVATWNVNGKLPGEDVSDWLRKAEHNDIIVVGFQEVVELTAQNVVLTADASKAKEWEEHISKVLGGPSAYSQLISKQLVGVYLCIFVKTEHTHHIRDVMWDTAGVGLMGMMGNKGAVGIRFTFYDSNLVFVNSHLSADRNNPEGRNQGFHDIMRRLAFRASESSSSAADGSDEPLAVLDHDLVVWLGDLNYRLNLGYEETHEHIRAGNLAALKQVDQLNIARKNKDAFVNWEEGELTFNPTYKYDPGTDNYVGDNSEKKRTPAWCDRILWVPGDNIKQVSYGRFEQKTSDHKPVSSTFACQIKTVLPDKEAAVLESVHRQLDQWENECLPSIKVIRSQLDFGSVCYGRAYTESVWIENDGKVAVKYLFAPKPGEGSICKRWLSVSSEKGMIVPGEKFEIRLQITIDNVSARALNSSEDTLEDILIFRLHKGRDFFISVSGEWMRTCFGSSIGALCASPDPVRTAKATSHPTSSTRMLSMPKEVWRIVDYIFTHGLNESELFLISGDPVEMEDIRECLDTGEAFGDVSVHAMAETLVHFLESLSEPIVPPHLFSLAQDASFSSTMLKQVLSEMPPQHYNVFVYLAAFMKELLKHEENGLTAEKLAVVFSNAFVHSQQSAPKHAYQESKQRVAFLTKVLTDDVFM